MNNKKKVRSAVKRIFSSTIFSARPAKAIVCPKCQTSQSREQDWCCSCGVLFIFLDETNRYA